MTDADPIFRDSKFLTAPYLPFAYLDPPSCSSGNGTHDVIWGFYFSSSVWDMTTLVISLWYLLRIKTSSALYAFSCCFPPPPSHVPRAGYLNSLGCVLLRRLGLRRLLTVDDRMLVDGLIYFVGMTAINVVNMIVFLDSNNPVRSGS